MIEVEPNFSIFNDDEEMYKKLYSFGFTCKDKKGNYKPLYYKGIETNEPVICKLLGIHNCNNNYSNFMIEVNGKKISINIDYFKEMQSNQFKLNNSTKEG